MRQPKGFMFDLDGTLILSDRKLGGYTAIPGAAEALAALDARGIPWIAMTNGSAYAASVQAPRLRAVGLPVADERLFTPKPGERVLGEASPLYIYVRETPGLVTDVIPDVKVVASLRHPVDRAWSHFLHVYRGDPEGAEPAFRQAVDDELALEYTPYRTGTHFLPFLTSS